jgi:intracellular sulfur oxidation DsrE/DsrF family protein
MKSKILSLLLVAMTFAVGTLKAQEKVDEKTHKIVFQLTTSDTLSHKALMKQLKNIKSVSPKTEIEVVCHGPGLEMLQTNKTTVFKGIQEAKLNGVNFQACEFSLKERKVEKSLIISEAGFVPAGIIYIVEKQEQGYSYIKSGF